MIIEGVLEEISDGSYYDDNFTTSAFLRFDGKRHPKFIYDKITHAALKNGVGKKVAISFTKGKVGGPRIIRAVKIENSEVYKDGFTTSITNIFQYLVLIPGCFLISAVIAFGLLSAYNMPFLTPFILLGIGFNVLIGREFFKAVISRNAFGSER